MSLPTKKHLLNKQLSKACIYDYQEIYTAVDVALKTVSTYEEALRNTVLAQKSVNKNDQIFNLILHFYFVSHSH